MGNLQRLEVVDPAVARHNLKSLKISKNCLREIRVKKEYIVFGVHVAPPPYILNYTSLF